MGRDALKSTNGLSKDVLSLNYEAQTFGNRLRTNLFAKIYQQSVSSLTYKGSVVDGQAVITEHLVEDSRSNTGYGLGVSYSITPKNILITSADRAVQIGKTRMRERCVT